MNEGVAFNSRGSGAAPADVKSVLVAADSSTTAWPQVTCSEGEVDMGGVACLRPGPACGKTTGTRHVQPASNPRKHDTPKVAAAADAAAAATAAASTASCAAVAASTVATAVGCGGEGRSGREGTDAAARSEQDTLAAISGSSEIGDDGGPVVTMPAPAVPEQQGGVAATPPTPPSLSSWLKKGPFVLAMAPGFFGFYAHIGCLRALEEADLLQEVSFATGASAGGLVAGLFAAGLSPADMGETVVKFRRSDFWDPVGFGGLLRGKKFEEILKATLPQGVRSFDRCRVPLAVSAFDVSSFATRTLEQGCIAQALRATCTFPGLFSPVWHDRGVLIDGGVRDSTGMWCVPEGREDCRRILNVTFGEKDGKGVCVPPSRFPTASNPRRTPNGMEIVSIAMSGLPRPHPFAMERGRDAMELSFIPGVKRLQSSGKRNDVAAMVTLHRRRFLREMETMDHVTIFNAQDAARRQVAAALGIPLLEGHEVRHWIAPTSTNQPPLACTQGDGGGTPCRYGAGSVFAGQMAAANGSSPKRMGEEVAVMTKRAGVETKPMGSSSSSSSNSGGNSWNTASTTASRVRTAPGNGKTADTAAENLGTAVNAANCASPATTKGSGAACGWNRSDRSAAAAAAAAAAVQPAVEERGREGGAMFSVAPVATASLEPANSVRRAAAASTTELDRTCRGVKRSMHTPIVPEAAEKQGCDKRPTSRSVACIRAFRSKALAEDDGPTGGAAGAGASGGGSGPDSGCPTGKRAPVAEGEDDELRRASKRAR